jgi:3-phenylpropionate/trans-cinnamate dioxygenase ferredoxin subunit
VTATTIDIGALDDFVEGVARRVELPGGPDGPGRHGPDAVAVVRIDDDLYAIGDRCTHQDISLSEGEVDRDERTLECWKHGSAFNLADGEPLSLPAVRPVPTYTVTVAEGRVLLHVDAAVDQGAGEGAA